MWLTNGYYRVLNSGTAELALCLAIQIFIHCKKEWQTFSALFIKILGCKKIQKADFRMARINPPSSR